MAYRIWRVGLHIQHHAMVCIALQRGRSGWALQRWWREESADAQSDEGRIATLRRWRREMPLRHRVAMALPAAGTLQKTLPAPGLALRDSEQAQWVVGSMARELEMPASSLAFDYRQTGEHTLHVTAARRQDVVRLRRMAAAAGLKVAAVTPDACALRAFFPWLKKRADGLSWFDGEQWLWATPGGWGYGSEPVGCPVSGYGDGFDPWQCLSHLQPPLPEQGDAYAVAIALSLGGPDDDSAG